VCYFFFQAEDGIRDATVTGVQTCALPIFTGKLAVQIAKILGAGRVVAAGRNEQVLSILHALGADSTIRLDKPDEELIAAFRRERSEERRVGKECRCRREQHLADKKETRVM